MGQRETQQQQQPAQRQQQPTSSSSSRVAAAAAVEGQAVKRRRSSRAPQPCRLHPGDGVLLVWLYNVQKLQSVVCMLAVPGFAGNPKPVEKGRVGGGWVASGLHSVLQDELGIALALVS